jgi:hypothetical protein
VGSALLSIPNTTDPTKMASGSVLLEDAYKQMVPHLKRLTVTLCDKADISHRSLAERLSVSGAKYRHLRS